MAAPNRVIPNEVSQRFNFVDERGRFRGRSGGRF